MKITFSGQGSGFGNNGGSATIYASANALHKLGHQVTLVSFEKSYFTWFKLDGPKYVSTRRYDYPDADILVATGASSVKHVLNSPSNKGVKFWWVRAHETWVTDQDTLLAHYRNPNLHCIVNSVCLQKYINRKIGKIFPIVKPGLDIEKLYPMRERDWKKKKTFVLGGLYNEKPRKRFKWIPEIYEQLAERLGKKHTIHLDLFGTYDRPKGFEFRNYYKKPTDKRKLQFYNTTDFWLAPTKSEGLHIPPQEAMLCEAVVIGANEELSGMADYLDHGNTGFIVPDWPEAVSLIEELILDPDRSELERVAKTGRGKILELGDREKNMKELLNYFDIALGRAREFKRMMRHRRRTF